MLGRGPKPLMITKLEEAFALVVKEFIFTFFAPPPPSYLEQRFGSVLSSPATKSYLKPIIASSRALRTYVKKDPGSHNFIWGVFFLFGRGDGGATAVLRQNVTVLAVFYYCVPSSYKQTK